MAWAPYPVHALTGGVSAPFTRALRPSKRALQCGRGGIGRRTGFRFQRRKAWGFESPRPHHRPARLGCIAIQACNSGQCRFYSRSGSSSRTPRRSTATLSATTKASVIVLKTLMHRNAADALNARKSGFWQKPRQPTWPPGSPRRAKSRRTQPAGATDTAVSSPGSKSTASISANGLSHGASPSPGGGGKRTSAQARGYCQPLDEASAATSLVGRANKPLCVI